MVSLRDETKKWNRNVSTIAAVLSCVNGRNAEGGEGLWDPMRGKTAKAAIAAFAPANQADNDNVNDNENVNDNDNENENENVNVGWPREARLPWGREARAPLYVYSVQTCVFLLFQQKSL